MPFHQAARAVHLPRPSNAEPGGALPLSSAQLPSLIEGVDRLGHADVRDISGRQRKGDRSTAMIGQGMDFARPTAARAGMGKPPP